MSLHSEILGSLFEMSSDPVIGIGSDMEILFTNPAAVRLGFHTGDQVDSALAEHVLSDPAEHFIATHRIGSQRASVSVRRLEGVAVCTFFLLSADPPSPAQLRAIQSMSSNLMTARMALDALAGRIEIEADPVLRDACNTLYKQYYLLRRSCLHLTQAAGALRGELPFQPRVLDLGTLCRELCDTVGRLAEGLGISVVFQADFSVHLTLADRDLLEHMLAGLLTNSLAHCKRGDTIRVELNRQGDRFIIAVNDPGSGIPPEKLAGIFSGTALDDMTDVTAGAGLGLLIARGISERHGGALILESRAGHGTSVRISIPCRQSGDTTVNTPLARYRSDGMNVVLTELSPLLDKKLFTRRMFD